MPVRERVPPAVGDRGTGAAALGRFGPARIRRQLSREAWRWLWLAAAVAQLALALTVGHGTGKNCAASRIAACAQASILPAVRPGAGRGERPVIRPGLNRYF